MPNFCWDEASADEDLDTRRRVERHVRAILAKLRHPKPQHEDNDK